MKAGVLGLVSEFTEPFESDINTVQLEDEPLQRAIEIRHSTTSSNGNLVQVGRAAVEQLDSKDTVEINEDSGSIQLVEETVREQKYTEFVAVPGEFVAVGSGSGLFAFDLLSEQRPEITISECSLDLSAIYDRSNNAHPWQVGFYGNIGHAEKGVVYGDDIFSDEEIGEVLERSQLNQLGLRYEFADETVKTTMSQSGYVEVFQPSNWDAPEFADFVISEILPAATESVA